MKHFFPESQREDTSIKFDGAGGGSFGICCKTPVLKDIYRSDYIVCRF